MFGKPQQKNVGNGANSGQVRPPVADVAQIQGGGLVQVIVTSLSPLTYFVFLNDHAVPQLEIESLNVVIEAPGQDGQGMIRATLARYVAALGGGKSQQRTELFPCTLEIVAQGRRLCVICQAPDSFDGLYVTMGLKQNGTDSELHGIRSLNVLLTEELLDARITWNEGDTEVIFPRSPAN